MHSHLNRLVIVCCCHFFGMASLQVDGCQGEGTSETCAGQSDCGRRVWLEKTEGFYTCRMMMMMMMMMINGILNPISPLGSRSQTHANSRDHTDLCLSQTEVEIMWIASGESGKRGPTVSRCALDDLDEFGGFWTSAEWDVRWSDGVVGHTIAIEIRLQAASSDLRTVEVESFPRMTCIFIYLYTYIYISICTQLCTHGWIFPVDVGCWMSTGAPGAVLWPGSSLAFPRDRRSLTVCPEMGMGKNNPLMWINVD